jgi:hypothetical protein
MATKVEAEVAQLRTKHVAFWQAHRTRILKEAVAFYNLAVASGSTVAKALSATCVKYPITRDELAEARLAELEATLGGNQP